MIGTAAPSTINSEIERYLRTGETDPYLAAWSGGVLERAHQANRDLRGALIDAVKRLGEGLTHAPLPEADTVSLTRSLVEPMVRGLFPRAEQEPVLAVLERSVVFLTSANIEQILMDESFDSTAWDLANLYLGSLGANLLGEEAPCIVGFGEDRKCYVSPAYFVEDDPFADFIVHEAAHIFHNCKRGTIGLQETRRKEWLLDIEFSKRESFAYSCEAYSRILQRAKTPTERRALAADYCRTASVSDERVDAKEVADIVAAAAGARNGWKTILARCSPILRRTRPAVR